MDSIGSGVMVVDQLGSGIGEAGGFENVGDMGSDLGEMVPVAEP